MSRLKTAIQTTIARGEKACGIFLTSGFPELGDTLDILHAIDEAGADFIELGMPFSDPLAEGRPIQRSSERALRNGIRMADTLRTAAQFRSRSETPLVLMGYINPIQHYGVERFCRDARLAGVDGLILPDLPPEESASFEEIARAEGLDMIYLIAPNTSEERMREVDRRSSGFVYAVSITGLTGTGLGVIGRVESYLEHARRLVTTNPLLVGFGIRTPEDAARLSRHTDGFIVGSALVDRIETLWSDNALTRADRMNAVARFVRDLKQGAIQQNTITQNI